MLNIVFCVIVLCHFVSVHNVFESDLLLVLLCYLAQHNSHQHSCLKASNHSGGCGSFGFDGVKDEKISIVNDSKSQRFFFLQFLFYCF